MKFAEKLTRSIASRFLYDRSSIHRGLSNFWRRNDFDGLRDNCEGEMGCEAMKIDYQVETPVAFLVFNRPDTTARVFAEIAEVRPKKLLMVADRRFGSRCGFVVLAP